jgi:hypothetical protein
LGNSRSGERLGRCPHERLVRRCAAHDNVSAQTAVFVGPLTQYAGFKLASSSPVGLNTASDGSNNGARIP